MITGASIDWIFFDCFNALVDDFDTTGYEAGLTPMYQVLVDAGLYADLAAVRADYHRWRRQYIAGKPKEQSLQQRFRHMVQWCQPDIDAQAIEPVLEEMEAQFQACFPAMLRLPPGVETMLQRWQGQVSMGVVSNFLLPQWPARMLERYGLTSYFSFVLDSAACGWRKPGVEIYQLALATAGSPAPERVLFIGDHLTNDVLAPRSLGFQAIYFDRSAERSKSAAAPADVTAITAWDQFVP